MAAFKGDLGAAIAARKESPVNYGPEFRDTTALEKKISIKRIKLRLSV